MGALLLLSAWMAVAALLVCPKCGFENPDGSTVCQHCQATLTPPPAAPEVTAPSQPVPAVATVVTKYLDPAAVEAEIELGRSYLKQQNTAVARLFFRNAAAIEMMTDPSKPSDRAARILKLIRSSDEALGAQRRECPACNGTGKPVFKATNLKGEEVRHKTTGTVCPVCRGTGYLVADERIDDRKFRQGRAHEEFQLVQQSRKYVPVGGAWVPQDFERGLTTRQRAFLKCETVPPCPTCAGTGRMDCDTCSGTGKVKCPNKNCVEGRVKAEQKKGRLQSAEKWDTCPVCHGTKVVNCPRCEGRGNILCTKCNGTGQLPICTKCGGQGYTLCARCKGTGTVKDVACAACLGEGVVLCTSCNGDGRKR